VLTMSIVLFPPKRRFSPWQGWKGSTAKTKMGVTLSKRGCVMNSRSIRCHLPFLRAR
jgi:hypothetical protein